MICPKCKHNDTRVIDSRDANEGRSIRRRRECEKCSQRFTTFEKPETTNFLVVKKDSSREAYDREKVERGIWRACEKRPVTEQKISDMLNKLEEVWSSRGKEVPADIIGRDVMHALKNIDEVSYIRFASVYRQFKDVESFKKELQKLLDR
ncbi:transcriptional regulator NrdR [Patescibacteria group bacterium]|nr:transcriptional regulator NrdR [Patescibacteria group bacterium]